MTTVEEHCARCGRWLEEERHDELWMEWEAVGDEVGLADVCPDCLIGSEQQDVALAYMAMLDELIERRAD
jgi:hypothetical protein